MELTVELLKQIMPQARKSKLEEFLIYLREYYKFAGLNTAKRMSSFLSQVGHESLEFLYMEEIASGKAYEGRKDLGNVRIGDGQRFKGRGPIQLTGRKNYEKFTLWVLKNQKAIWEFPPKSIPNFVEKPNLVSTMEWGLLAAIWYWQSRKINEASDKIEGFDIEIPTRRVNGGVNGLAERTEYYKRAITILQQYEEAA